MLTQNHSRGQETELYGFETLLSIENSYWFWNKSSHLWLSEKFKCWQHQLVGQQIRKMNTLSWDWAKVNVLQYIQNCLDTQRGWKKKKRHIIKNKTKSRSSACVPLPILLQIVTRSSPTVLESSTITVFTDPSSIRIFWGLCFFLYSKISYSKIIQTSHTAWEMR